jgi:hypothetical protein
MTFLKVLGLVVAGAGTFASILGVFLAKAVRDNGKATRELIANENKAIRELIEKISALIVAEEKRQDSY